MLIYKTFESEETYQRTIKALNEEFKEEIQERRFKK